MERMINSAEEIAYKYGKFGNRIPLRNSIEKYAQSQLQELREELENMKGERDAAYLRKKILNLIDQLQDEY